MIGPSTRGRVLGMGASVKLRDLYGPSSSSQCSKRCQADRLKEKEDFELHFKEVEDKNSAEKMELQGTINQSKEKMLHMIANALKKMGFNSIQEPTTQVYLYIFQYNQHQYRSEEHTSELQSQ